MLIWHPDTEKELVDGATYYNHRQPGLGEEFIDEMTKAASIIIADPERAREFDPPYRKVATDRFSYQLVYEIRKDQLRIIAVMHQSRRPGYWKNRAKDRVFA